MFRRSSTFGLFVLLATGLVARTNRRTVVGMLAGAGMAAVVSFHSACRFFSTHRWEPDRLGLAVARLVVARLLPADAAITVAVDDTLFRRWGKKVHHAFWTHDGAAQGPAKLGRGNRWVIAGIVVRLPFSSGPACLPVLFRLWAGKGTASPVELAGELLTLLADAFPAGAFTPSGTPPTTACRWSWPAPRSPPGCPPTPPCTPRPRRAPAGAAAREEGPPARPPAELAGTATWRTVTRPGTAASTPSRSPTSTACGTARSATPPAGWCWCATPKPAPATTWPCSPPTATRAEHIVARYADRWTIEPANATGKQLLGVGQARNRLPRAVERTVPFGFLSRPWSSSGTPPHGHHPDDLTARHAAEPWYDQQDRTRLRGHARQAPPHPDRRPIYRHYPKPARPHT